MSHAGTQNLSRKGRPLGATNKLPLPRLIDRCLDAGYDPIAAIVEIADGDIKCLACRGKLVNKYPVTDEDGNRLYDADGNIKVAERLCQSCYGTGWEILAPETLLKARIAIFDKLVPSLKQVEHTGDAAAQHPGWVVQIVNAVAPAGGGGERVPPQVNARKEE